MSEIIDYSGNALNCNSLSIVGNEIIDSNKNIFVNNVNATNIYIGNTNLYMSMIKLMLQNSSIRDGCKFRLDLSHFDFSAVNFTNMDLCHINFTGANFAGANLTKVNFYYSNLTGANLSGANLTNAHFSHTIFTDFVGVGADITDAKFHHSLGTPLVDFDSILSSGIVFKSYNGYFNDNIHFNFVAKNGLNGVSAGIVTDLSNLNASTNGNFVDTAGQSVFTITWKGFFYAQISGTYEFTLASDDASFFWLNTTPSQRTVANVIIENSGNHPVTTKKAKVNLVSGCYYPLYIIYGQNLGDYSCSFTFVRPVGILTNPASSWYYY